MKKEEFLKKLSSELYFMSYDEREEVIKRYSDIIDDLMNNGYLEEDAVNSLNSPINIARYLKNSTEFRFKVPKKKNKVIAGLVIIVSSPLWGALLILTLTLVLGIFLLIWTVPVTTFLLFIASVFGGGYSVLGSFILITNNVAEGIMQLGVGIMFIGLSILLFLATVDVTRFIAGITVKISKSAESFIKEKIMLKG